MSQRLLNVIISLLTVHGICGLNITYFEVPDVARVGQSVLLVCLYDLKERPLYTLKWYRDEREFFRLEPKAKPQVQFFQVPGINIDVRIYILWQLWKYWEEERQTSRLTLLASGASGEAQTLGVSFGLKPMIKSMEIQMEANEGKAREEKEGLGGTEKVQSIYREVDEMRKSIWKSKLKTALLLGDLCVSLEEFSQIDFEKTWIKRREQFTEIETREQMDAEKEKKGEEKMGIEMEME